MSAISPECIALPEFTLTRGGRPALDILRSNKLGRVAALFEHSLYIAFDQNWVCLGSNDLPMGPLNLCAAMPAGMSWEACGLQIEDLVTSAEDCLAVGATLKFATADVVPWDPPAPGSWNVQTLMAGLDALDRFGGPDMDRGLGNFVTANSVGHQTSRIEKAAERSVKVLSQAVERAFRIDPIDQLEIDAAVIALLGLGPGLTPSGDDFLGGMLIALNTLPAPALRTHLFALIEHHAPHRTNAISLAHLRAAGAGAGHQALHEILKDLLAGKTEMLPNRMIAIDKIGHFSGWDALAGICVTLRAYLAAETRVTTDTG